MAFWPKRSPSRQRPKPRQSQHPLPAPRLKPPPPLGGFFIGLFRRSEALPLWPAAGTEALQPGIFLNSLDWRNEALGWKYPSQPEALRLSKLGKRFVLWPRFFFSTPAQFLNRSASLGTVFLKGSAPLWRIAKTAAAGEALRAAAAASAQRTRFLSKALRWLPLFYLSSSFLAYPTEALR